MSNLQYWEKVKQPVAGALKTIKAGRLKGMSDISPQWRFYAMTETFGPVGIGWKYTIERQWLEEGDAVERCAFTNINLYFKHDGEWSEPIPGTGGSSFVTQESSRVYTSDEAFKMSLTDALSVAMKAIGVAANIYSGNQDYSKYTAPESGSTQQTEQQQQSTATGKPFYNDFHKQKGTMLAKLDSGEYANPEAIISKLSEKFKISGKDRDLIKGLVQAN